MERYLIEDIGILVTYVEGLRIVCVSLAHNQFKECKTSEAESSGSVLCKACLKRSLNGVPGAVGELAPPQFRGHSHMACTWFLLRDLTVSYQAEAGLTGIDRLVSDACGPRHFHFSH